MLHCTKMSKMREEYNKGDYSKWIFNKFKNFHMLIVYYVLTVLTVFKTKTKNSLGAVYKSHANLDFFYPPPPPLSHSFNNLGRLHFLKHWVLLLLLLHRYNWFLVHSQHQDLVSSVGVPLVINKYNCLGYFLFITIS